MNALLIAALARARMAAKPVRKSAWSDDHRSPHLYAPHDAITREGARALATEGFLLQLSAWREEKTDGGLLLVADMGLWHASSGLWWPMAPWKEPLEGGSDRGKAWHAAQVAARAYAHREVCSLEVLDESRAAGLPLPPKEEEEGPAPVDGLSQEDRDAFARAVGAPTEEEERELRKAETEARLRAAAPPPSPPPLNGATNGTHLPPFPPSQERGGAPMLPEKRGELLKLPHVDPDPTIPPVKWSACPSCRAATPEDAFFSCAGCGRRVCIRCAALEDLREDEEVDPSPPDTCTDCNTAEQNADCAPPFLSDEATEKARVLLARDDHSLVEVCKAVGVDYLGEGPLGCLLGYDGCRFRLSAVDLERWLRGDLTVGVDEGEDEDDQGGEGAASVPAPSEPPAPSTSPGAGSLTGETAAASVAPTEPTPAGTSPDGASHTEPSAPSSLPESAGPAASPPEVPAVQSPAEASGGGAPLRCPDCLDPIDGKGERAPNPGKSFPCPKCETWIRIMVDIDQPGPLWAEVAGLLTGSGTEYEHVPTGRHVRYVTRIGQQRSVRVRLLSGVPLETEDCSPGPDGNRVDVDASELRAWSGAPGAPIRQPTPALLSAVDVILANGEAARKALGKEWAEFPSHRATKKPAGSCALCEKEIPKGDLYHDGRGKKWTRKRAHGSCVLRLSDGKDPKVNERHELEREAIDRLTPAAAGVEA